MVGVDGTAHWRDIVPAGTKGVPMHFADRTLGEVQAESWNALRDAPMPVAVLKARAIDHNLHAMMDFANRIDVRLAPHAKTTMAPQLFAQQLRAGAWGLTAALPTHVAVYRRAGVDRIILANELVDVHGLAYLRGELDRDPSFELLTIVDSERAVDALESAFSGARALVGVLVEVGTSGGRGGVRTVAEAVRLAERVHASGALELRGVETFEGIFGPRDALTAADQVDGLLGNVVAAANAIAGGCGFARTPIVTAGGSIFFERVAETLRAGLSFDAELILRSGCYLTSDHGFYALARREEAAHRQLVALEPALEVWGQVLSRPEPHLALVGVGKRDISHDLGNPVPLRWCRRGDPMEVFPAAAAVQRLNDHHAYLAIPSDHPLEVGDLVGFGCSHPCTTFDRWSHMALVNEDYDVRELIRTYF